VSYLGIDPGARYTGVVVRDGDELLSASTIVRPPEIPAVSWALLVPRIIEREVVAAFPSIVAVGIEGISDPKGWQGGKKSPINPKDIIRAGMVLGACAERFHGRYPLVIVPPKKNGSGGFYPAALTGRRPASLHGAANGAGTRDHERSAWDIAGETPFLISDNFSLDTRDLDEFYTELLQSSIGASASNQKGKSTSA
jgi:hypothetical protein